MFAGNTKEIFKIDHIAVLGISRQDLIRRLAMAVHMGALATARTPADGGSLPIGFSTLAEQCPIAAQPSNFDFLSSSFCE